MRINRRCATGRSLIAGLVFGLLVGNLSGCAALPQTVSPQSVRHETRTHGPPVPKSAALRSLQANESERSARFLPAMKRTGEFLLDLVLPIPSGNVPAWANQTQADCFAQVLSQWCTQFHLQ